MTSKVIILVSDREDERHGEVSILDDIKKAQHLVETLIEAGFELERIRVFSGGEMEVQVTQRPVVTLAKADAFAEEKGAAEAEEPDTDSEEAATSISEGARLSSLFRSG